MFEKLVSALCPIIVTLLVGYYASYRKKFDLNDATKFNQFVLNYALPFSLFGSIISIKSQTIIDNLSVGFWVIVAMVGGYIITFLISHYLLKRPISIAGLRALAINGPSIVYVGPIILGTIFPKESPLIISFGGITLNLFLMPVTVILISMDQSGNTNYLRHFINALKKPVVFAPIVATILVFLGFNIDPLWERNFTVIGGTTSGMALFSSGIILERLKPSFSFNVLKNVFLKLIIVPLVMFLIMSAVHTSSTVITQIVITVGISSAAIVTTFSNQYHVAEKEMVSTLFFSTILSVISLAVIMLIRGV
ncbi:AEC family transporter (plasmid) [Nicoliella spurrieriana]|uniref:AEC family transporter n=1 Tax=Nicoliella spurrieriana TaxID=2925830 RepID=A0A976RQV8_9LACO|nr:AEC family transporter [Nicoliella spurrieriana]UQS86095.1 AEC family transporter [Nicoliella spurrieriana]